MNVPDSIQHLSWLVSLGGTRWPGWDHALVSRQSDHQPDCAFPVESFFSDCADGSKDTTVSNGGPDVDDNYDINPNKTEIWALWKEAASVMDAKSGQSSA